MGSVHADEISASEPKMAKGVFMPCEWTRMTLGQQNLVVQGTRGVHAQGHDQ